MALRVCANCGGKNVGTEEMTCPICGNIAPVGRRVSRLTMVIVTLIAMALILYPVIDMAINQ